MIIVFKPQATPAEIEDVKQHIIDLGYDPRVISGVERTVIGAVGDELSHRSLEILKSMPSVEDVVPIQKRYKLATRAFHPADTVVKVGQACLGGGHFQVIAGPCAIESFEQLRTSVRDLAAAGVQIIRGMAYKPRTSPYDFQGVGDEALEWLAAVKREFNVAVVTEVLGTNHLDKVAAVADMLQIGARNCQNYHLLEVTARAGRPVLLKRGMATSVEEWLSAAEYLMVNGCPNVVLCERGIRTFETATRNTLDLSIVPLIKELSHLPLIIDPSHATGRRTLVPPMAKAALVVGAHGLMVEVHPEPDKALSDGPQSLTLPDFAGLMREIEKLIDFLGY